MLPNCWKGESVRGFLLLLLFLALQTMNKCPGNYGCHSQMEEDPHKALTTPPPPRLATRSRTWNCQSLKSTCQSPQSVTVSGVGLRITSTSPHFCTSHECISLAECKPYPEPKWQGSRRSIALRLPAPGIWGQCRRAWYEY